MLFDGLAPAGKGTATAGRASPLPDVPAARKAETAARYPRQSEPDSSEIAIGTGSPACSRR